MTPITFLSLGPGDPELLTLKAVKTLKEADIVMVPATRSTEGTLRSRATEIIGEWCDNNRLRVFELPMLKDRQAVSLVYDAIYNDCAKCYHEDQRVVVAVEGDVSIYASIHYVMDRLQSQGIPTVQSAGIPSFIAAAAEAGLSLVSQQQRLTILPGDADIETLRQLLDSNHVVVVMKLSQCQEVVKSLLQQEAHITCHYFENVGMSNAFHTTNFEEIIARQMPYFSICILSASPIQNK
ncbi:precorrin-2 C(20)-methyltransferase [Xylanibacter brevis]|uniref:precorrin-2 C(20)-methyltransferase n=1 Tax=Xylanibacter brevis TaxID=83231 RepID=UPI000483B4EB|nr:precorrin-2 C(20)-methyltransferase [Xylanibacter brevis]